MDSTPRHNLVATTFEQNCNKQQHSAKDIHHHRRRVHHSSQMPLRSETMPGFPSSSCHFGVSHRQRSRQPVNRRQEDGKRSSTTDAIIAGRRCQCQQYPDADHARQHRQRPRTDRRYKQKRALKKRVQRETERKTSRETDGKE